jgi:hypothetical protein
MYLLNKSWKIPPDSDSSASNADLLTEREPLAPSNWNPERKYRAGEALKP